jgi:hypothetical protein
LPEPLAPEQQALLSAILADGTWRTPVSVRQGAQSAAAAADHRSPLRGSIGSLSAFSSNWMQSKACIHACHEASRCFIVSQASNERS